MSEDWVNECWSRRNELPVFATDPELMVHKQMPFKGLTIALFGFTAEDEQHMKETATDNGMSVRVWERERFVLNYMIFIMTVYINVLLNM